MSLWRESERTYVRRTETKFSQSSPSNIFFNTPIGELINYSGRNGLVHISENADLVDVIKLLNSRRMNARRLALRREDGQFSGIICPSDLAKFMNKNIDSFKLADMKLRELNMVKTCLMVRQDVPMYDTISLLADTKVSGLALVDWEFNIVANFGCSDLKGLLPDAFDAFYGTTLDFLRQGTSTKSFIPPITCTPDTRLREVLSKMTSETNPVHRLFVTRNENTNRLEGLCSLTDLITMLGESLNIPPELKAKTTKEIPITTQGRPISVE
jgi:CBS domain-containing protein